jgi:hypothetical protein
MDLSTFPQTLTTRLKFGFAPSSAKLLGAGTLLIGSQCVALPDPARTNDLMPRELHAILDVNARLARITGSHKALTRRKQNE